jgi:tetratricopeptide (TPR) repeat protein
MVNRGYGGIALLLIAGCGNPNAPSEVAGEVANEPSTISNPVTISTLEFDDTVQQMQEAGRSQRYEEAVELAEKALELQPDDVVLLVNATRVSRDAAIQLAKSGGDRKLANEFFFKSAAFIRKLRGLQRDAGGVPIELLTTAIYNEARAHATNGNTEKALASLQEALESGPVDLAQLEAEVDFESCRNLPEFVSMLTKAKEDESRPR